jgi:hypothetical protein
MDEKVTYLGAGKQKVSTCGSIIHKMVIFRAGSSTITEAHVKFFNSHSSISPWK